MAAPAGPAVPADPAEVMTQAELATIPDPVPEGEPRPGSPSLRPAPGDAASGDATGATDDTGSAERPSAADQSMGGPAGGSSGTSAGFLWRVQIFASSDLAQADRVAKGAAQRLGVEYVIQFEGTLYKVRLGAFASEADAQSLRERTVWEGFPGAFRVRTAGEGTGGTD
jgi:peptidoglycan lytic transglycosylase